jgi:hypothetical protein
MKGESYPPAPPAGVIASFCSYDAALGAVNRLAAERFPVHRLAIVAADVRFIERVTGRTARGVVHGVAGGAIVGAASGSTVYWLGWADSVVPALAVLLAGLLPGAVVGGAIALAGLVPGRRRFASVASVEATRFELLCDVALVDEAARLLHQPSGPGRTGTSPHGLQP